MPHSEPKYPEITVQLTGEDGNAFAILGRTKVAFRRAGIKDEEWAKLRDEAISGDYDHLLQIIKEWVSVR